jgi:hypothetical protein
MNSLTESTPKVPLDELRSMAAEPDWRRVEATLLAAFSARTSDDAATAPIVSASTAADRSLRSGRARWRWMSVAAGVVLAAAMTFVPVPKRDRTLPLPAPQPSAPAPRPAAPAPVSRGTTQVSAPPAKVAPAPPARRAPASQATTRRTGPSSAGLDGFVVLPGAFALPDFESGRIVRVEVPLAGLPAYGIDLVPDALPSAVQADFLIGQDGVPRAIRLASNLQP